MQKIATKVVDVLSKIFTDKPALNFNSNYELLIAVILSAQCTDERVNKVTANLFKEYNTPEKVLSLTQEELEKYIFSCGLYKSKANHILSATRDIIYKFNGNVPNNLKDLTSLKGVGRKTANVVYSVAFKGNAIAVDTHVFRVANRIGLATGKTPIAVEKGLMSVLNEKDWSRAHHYLIYLGRGYCKAKNPDCANCPINDYCNFFKVKNVY